MLSCLNFHEYFLVPETIALFPEWKKELTRYALLLRAGRTEQRHKLANALLRSLSPEQRERLEGLFGPVRIAAPDNRLVLDEEVGVELLGTHLNGMARNARDVTISRYRDKVYISILR